jgi:catecholate siderophore receptor
MHTEMTNGRLLSAKPAFLALSCVGAFMTAPATANAVEGPSTTADEQQREREERDDIVVEGERYKELESPKYTAPLLDTPQTITVIGDQIIRKQNLLTLRDALSTVPGITFGAGEGGGGYGDSINLRGQTANNDLQIDGVRDSAQYSRSDTFNLEQIEVINGANSVYGGSGAISGTINLVSKRPNANNLTIVQGGVGTDDYYRATVDSNVRVSDLIAVRLNGMIHRNDVPGRDFDKYKRWGIAPSLKIGAEGPTSLTFLYVHQEDENTPQYGVPYYKNAFYNGPLPGVPDSGYYGYKDVDRQDQTIDQATIIFAHDFSDTVSIRNLTRWQRVDQDVVVDPPQAGTWCLANGVTQAGVACLATQNRDTYYVGGPRGTTRLSSNQIMYNQVDLRAQLDTGGIKHAITLGASAMQEDYDLSSGNSLRNPFGATPNPLLPTINITNPNAIYGGPINFIRTSQAQGDTRNLAVYLFDAIALTDQFEINAGLRYENNRAKFRSDTIIGSDTLAGPETNFGQITRGAVLESEDNLFSYRVGLVFKPIQNASLYAAYGNSRNPTSVSVRASCGTTAEACDAPPEETVNYEFGGKIDLFGKKLQLTAAAFRNERTNYRVIANDPALPSATLPVNDGRARVDGIALGASGNITKAWSIFANYTYLDTEIKQSVSDFCRANPGRLVLNTATPPALTNPCGNSTAVLDTQVGQELVQTPKHSGSLFTTYTLPFGLQLGYGLTYQGSFALNNSALATPLAAGTDGRANGTALTPVYRTDAYTTHRAFLSYPFGNGLTAQVNVQNFTNTRYFTSIRNNGWAVPGEDRSAVFSLYYSF